MRNGMRTLRIRGETRQRGHAIGYRGGCAEKVTHHKVLQGILDFLDDW